MIINNVTIENFRCYYGSSSIPFSTDGKITLIYGDSGYGKSSFLQFLRWMFYGVHDFGNKDDKPLFNLHKYEETKSGGEIRVGGRIDFEHLGVKYTLTKDAFYKKTINPKAPQTPRIEICLQHLVGDNWERYSGDISNKINTILPVGLSTYFLLDGEKSRDIVLDSDGLQKAIHQLFGIDAYKNAVDHLSHGKNSVIGQYRTEMASKINEKVGGMSASDFQTAINSLNDKIDVAKERRKSCIETIKKCNERRIEIFKVLGQAENKSTIVALIAAQETMIDNYEKAIKDKKNAIGNLLYKSYPYLLLSNLTVNSSAVLREKNKEFALTQKTVFQNITKDLLKEILSVNSCVCGRCLDDESKNKISTIMGIMPPDSYEYQFHQFVNKSKEKIRNSRRDICEVDNLRMEINQLLLNIEKCNDSIKEKRAELKRLDDSKELVEELENLDRSITDTEKLKGKYEKDINDSQYALNIANNKLSAVLKNSAVTAQYQDKIDFFTQIAFALDQERKQMEKTVQISLNECVRDVFKRLTTQTELDADSIQFVNNDFSLRKTYLTGGQLSVDVYSYIIGIVKALQKLGFENNENPIVVDAPFAFTGNEQSEHIFRTLPTVSKQTVLLTLDLNKVRDVVINKQDLYDLYVIDNISQDKAVLRKGEINDIKF